MAELNLFSIPAGAPFLDVLAQAMLDGVFGPVYDPNDPTVMARTTLYLPTRRAARAFAARLSEKLAGRPLLLPRIVPLGDVDEAETALIGAGGWAGGRISPIDPLMRRLVLTRLVAAWGASANRSHLKLDPAEPSLVPATLAEAYDLAGDLAALLDQMQTEGVDIGRLGKLDAARFDAVWQLNASFLAILGEAWPGILDARGACDPAAFRNRMLAAETQALREGAATGPIIAAGSTGTVPATARLLAVLARLPQGAVVLPDLDLGLPDPAWTAIADEPAPSHPQAALHHLMEVLGAQRGDVRVLGAPDAVRAARGALLREAMLPASVTELWSDLATRLPVRLGPEAFTDLRIVEAADERTEALGIAIALRETLETSGAQAALITPDRGLAERVAVELGRWGVAVDDSAGLALGRWPTGALLRLIVEAALGEMAPSCLVSLLAHPCCRLGLTREQVARGAAALEIGSWRGEPVSPGLAGLKAAFARRDALQSHPHTPRPRRRMTPDDHHAGEQVLAALEQAMAPLLGAIADAQPRFGAFVAAAKLAVEATGRDEEGRVLAFAGADGEALATLFDDLDNALPDAPTEGRPLDFAAMLESLLAERVVKRAGSGHARVKIWGLLEARLLEADHIVLGGLNETVWPPDARTDSFLNRPMRAELGLSPPERRIGQTAHDFVQAMMAPKVTLTRSRKSGEAETIASRFWQRLKAVTPASTWDAAATAGQEIVALAARLDAPAATAPIARPAPRPARHLQPVALSVTEIETLYRDPYQIHARTILKLDALDELVADPGAADRGNLLHEIVAVFAKAHPRELPPDALELLVRIGDHAFSAFDETPEVRAFWWPRFLITAGHFIAWEERRRGELDHVCVEQGTSDSVSLADGTRFRLGGRADRIEVLRLGTLRLIDFKTGAPPSKAQIEKGFAPQLTLEAVLAARAGFPPEIGPAPVEGVAYVKLHHDAKAWAKDGTLVFAQDEPLADVAARHLQRLIGHLDALRSGREAYLSRRAPDYIKYTSPYDQLARVKEWSAAPGGSEPGAEP